MVVASLTYMYAAIPSCHTGTTAYVSTKYGVASRSRSTTSIFPTNATTAYVKASAIWPWCAIVISSKHAYVIIRHGTTSISSSGPGSPVFVILYCKKYANILLVLSPKYYFGIILFLIFLFQYPPSSFGLPQTGISMPPQFQPSSQMPMLVGSTVVQPSTQSGQGIPVVAPQQPGSSQAFPTTATVPVTSVILFLFHIKP